MQMITLEIDIPAPLAAQKLAIERDAVLHAHECLEAVRNLTSEAAAIYLGVGILSTGEFNEMLVDEQDTTREEIEQIYRYEIDEIVEAYVAEQIAEFNAKHPDISDFVAIRIK